MTGPTRRTPPLGVKLEAALQLCSELMQKLGFEPVEAWELDHVPALGLRAVNEAGTDWEPAQHDVRYLVWRPKRQHREKTSGRRGESRLSVSGDGDVSRIAKVKRITGQTGKREKPKRAWPKRKLQSRNTFARRQG